MICMMDSTVIYRELIRWNTNPCPSVLILSKYLQRLSQRFFQEIFRRFLQVFYQKIIQAILYLNLYNDFFWGSLGLLPEILSGRTFVCHAWNSFLQGVDMEFLQGFLQKKICIRISSEISQRFPAEMS